MIKSFEILSVWKCFYYTYTLIDSFPQICDSKVNIVFPLIFEGLAPLSSNFYCCFGEVYHFYSWLFQFSCSVVSNSLQPHEPQYARPPRPSPIPGVYSKSCPLSQWCHPAISSSVVPFSSCPQSLPASRSFPMSQHFTWGGQSIGVSASASVCPMNTQDWSPLGWAGLISLQSKGLSRVFSNTITVQKHQFFSTQLSSQSNSHIIHDHWKNHSCDQTDLCWQSNISAF